MQPLYFAYGSNLCPDRMRERIPSARAHARARLPGHRLTTDKLGRDGSGKANVTADVAASVWGVLYAVDAAHWTRLDRYEPGYARIEVAVETITGDRLWAETYRAEVLSAAVLPFASYKRLIVEGARHHGLPTDYVALLEALPEQPDAGDLT